MSRIDADRPLYESWPVEIQEAVHNGQVKVGMTPQMVEMSVGKPADRVNRSVKVGEDEIWVYRSTGNPPTVTQTTGVSASVGTGGANVRVGTGVSVKKVIPLGGKAGPAPEEHEVAFKNGVVVRSDL
jgi:hypothetical protein